jgi:serine/threonine protein kinase
MSDQDLPSIRVGDVLAGKYQVERVLGVGGMGIVVAARHTDLQELRAIKLMLGNFALHPEAVERFLREARAAVRLKSEHVAKVHDVGRLETGAPYMVMEYLEGCDLQQLLKSQGPLPLWAAVTYVLQACEALAEAHAAGIVHRDIKPANLFLTKSADGLPSTKVLDFGISKFTPPAGSAPALDMTKTTAILGSPLYMSPEQMASTRNVDLRTDIWALGVVLYQLTTGVVPFQAESITQLCAMVLQQEPMPPSLSRPGLPVEFDRVVMRCLQKAPAQRYANIVELATDLFPFGADGARISVDRVRRTLGMPVPHPSLSSSPSLTSVSQAASQSFVPHGTGPLAAAQSGPVGNVTSATWGQTASGGKRNTPVAAIALSAVLGVTVLGVGIGFVVHGRSQSTALSGSEVPAAPPTPATLSSGVQDGAPAPSGVSVAPAAQPAPSSGAPAGSASAKAVARLAPGTTSTAPSKVVGAGSPRSTPLSTPAPVNPFGDERK